MPGYCEREGYAFVIEEGPCVVEFGMRWKEGQLPSCPVKRREAMLATLDSLYTEIERPWREGEAV